MERQLGLGGAGLRILTSFFQLGVFRVRWFLWSIRVV